MGGNRWSNAALLLGFGQHAHDAADSAGRSGVTTPDCLRQYRQPAVGACYRPAERDCGSRGYRRDSPSSGAAVSHREPVVGADRRRRRFPACLGDLQTFDRNYTENPFVQSQCTAD